jgi:hypothetical protein
MAMIRMIRFVFFSLSLALTYHRSLPPEDSCLVVVSIPNVPRIPRRSTQQQDLLVHVSRRWIGQVSPRHSLRLSPSQSLSALPFTQRGEDEEHTKGQRFCRQQCRGLKFNQLRSAYAHGALHFASHHFLSCQTTLQPKQVLPFHPKRTAREVPLENAQCRLRSPRNAEASSSLLLTC